MCAIMFFVTVQGEMFSSAYDEFLSSIHELYKEKPAHSQFILANTT